MSISGADQATSTKLKKRQERKQKENSMVRKKLNLNCLQESAINYIFLESQTQKMIKR